MSNSLNPLLISVMNEVKLGFADALNNYCKIHIEEDYGSLISQHGGPCMTVDLVSIKNRLFILCILSLIPREKLTLSSKCRQGNMIQFSGLDLLFITAYFFLLALKASLIC